MKKGVNITVAGRVQGVGFRYFVYNKARGLGLTGYVKNNSDRTVSVVAEGDERILNMFVESVKRGPEVSRVEKVRLKYYNTNGEYNEFNITG